ncbi:uncharacterized protein PG986_013775 [Apiospora aurea]|uniref:Uncharacterized protein n=1 Tax=Apiospora aurea TaxID=335848 RepID=A0ABR1PWH3_9PEZI
MGVRGDDSSKSPGKKYGLLCPICPGPNSARECLAVDSSFVRRQSAQYRANMAYHSEDQPLTVEISRYAAARLESGHTVCQGFAMQPLKADRDYLPTFSFSRKTLGRSRRVCQATMPLEMHLTHLIAFVSAAKSPLAPHYRRAQDARCPEMVYIAPMIRYAHAKARPPFAPSIACRAENVQGDANPVRFD